MIKSLCRAVMSSCILHSGEGFNIFVLQASKFVSGIMSALSAMVTLEVPHINVLSKLDLLGADAKKELEK